MHFLVNDFFRFHHNCFRDTMNWECIVEDNCVRSCLIELKSFLLTKFDVEPIQRILVHFPLFACKKQNAVFPSQFCSDLCVLCS